MDGNNRFSIETDGYAKQEVDEYIASLEAQLHEKTRMLREMLQRLDETRQSFASSSPELYERLEAETEGDFDEDESEEAAESL